MAPDTSAALRLAPSADAASDWMPIGFTASTPVSLVDLHTKIRKLRGKVTGAGRGEDATVRIELIGADGKDLAMPTGVQRIRFVV